MKPIVIANWKMNEVSSKADDLAEEIATAVSKYIREIDVVICPPYTALEAISEVPGIIKGAQDIHWQDKGTFTGEVSGPMLKDLGCEYVIIGHSERRWKMGENDDIINKKLLAALRNKLIPVLCIGEKAADRQDRRTREVLKQQLESAWRGIGREDCNQIVIAYEPVWAIGSGQIGSKEAATPEIIAEAYNYIKDFILAEELSDKVRLVYGGSVEGDNVNEFFQVQSNEGFLVGGASLEASEFSKIIKKTAQNYD